MKTTKRQFQLFKSEAQKWLNKFGLTDWHVEFEHAKINPDCNAEVYTPSLPSMKVLLTLNLEPDREDYPDEEIKETALHEVLHVLFMRFSCLAKWRYSTELELDEAEHAIVFRLIKNFK